MITTLTLNPSFDRTMTVDRLRRGEVHRAGESRVEPAGKGINVARALVVNGGRARAVFPANDAAVEVFRPALESVGVSCDVAPRRATTRSNISVVEADGTTTKLNEPGPPLDEATLATLFDRGAALEDADDRVVVAGSLPAGNDVDLYARFAERLDDPQRTLVADSSGAALRALLDVGCAVVKPNLDELIRRSAG